jgi:phosphodiesterase/alkaline phosphatase D-like protein
MVQFPPPIVKTIAATRVHKTWATLHARVDPNGNAVTVSFQYSRRANMTRAKATRNVRLKDGTSPVRVSAVIAHLAKHTRYYYRVTVTEIQQRSTVRGHVLSFKTEQG